MKLLDCRKTEVVEDDLDLLLGSQLTTTSPKFLVRVSINKIRHPFWPSIEVLNVRTGQVGPLKIVYRSFDRGPNTIWLPVGTY